MWSRRRAVALCEILGGLDSKYISAAGTGYFQDGDKTRMPEGAQGSGITSSAVR
ncbi:hypothetical protein [Streptomyces nojiriensis]|uniref:hypothetical protein n=1 Tax=Streptomyces nojiriensis TaxID=66374 RepID=UPI0036640443